MKTTRTLHRIEAERKVTESYVRKGVMWVRWSLFAFVVLFITGCGIGLGQQVWVADVEDPCREISPGEVQDALEHLHQVAAAFKFECDDPIVHPKHPLAFCRHSGIPDEAHRGLKGSDAGMILGADLSSDGCTFYVSFVEQTNSGETEFSQVLRDALVSALSEAFPEREVRHDSWKKILF